jgi:uncharacterized 2Fe-2S/4Fe-4S cluster protein (DUF4445 family)
LIDGARVLACQEKVHRDTEVEELSVDAKPKGKWRREIWEGSVSKLGACVDIGTTTIALSLCDVGDAAVAHQTLWEASAQNPQIRFGADVVARILHATARGGNGLEDLRRPLLDAIASLAVEGLSELGMTQMIEGDLVIVGNTTMHHIFLGLDPSPLGKAPFSPTVVNAIDTTASLLGLGSPFAPSLPVHVLPIVAGHVGADFVSAAVSSGIATAPDSQLWALLDIGTNCEVAIGSSRRMLACSCPTGPALEGGQITCGMRAAAGAIDTVRVQPKSFDVQYTTIESNAPSGICGSGLIDTIAELRKAGALLQSGRWSPEVAECSRFRKVGSAKGEFVIATAE